jgi:hypothetical protein
MLVPFLAAVFVTLSPCHLITLSSGAEGPYDEDLRFVRELRSRGYSDLAREYLDKLAKNAPPALQKELPLEKALTDMEAAADEPDSGKRMSLYVRARADFQKFLSDNPNHPRAAEARLDIAHATTLQGKAQLSRALLEEDLRSRIAEGLKARATLLEAYNLLKQLPSTPQTQLAMGLNLIDQAQTYLNTGSDQEMAERGKPVQAAQKILEKLAQGSANDKITWLARVWAARCVQELGEPKKARDKYLEITSATGPAVQDGKRLARYFLLLVAKETREAPNMRNVESYILERASDWMLDYPSYARTPEGYGIRYLAAETLLAEADNPKPDLGAAERRVMIERARRYLRDIEQTENDFTDRAKRLKIVVLKKQGAFRKPIKELNKFEDCYVRAQYEIMQIGEDIQKYKDNKEQRESARKAHIATAIDALQAGLKKPDAKSFSAETSNAHAMLAYYLMTEGKYKECIEVGEPFAKANPKRSQAATAAIYALLSYDELIAQRERNAADLKALQRDADYQGDVAHMLELAKYMEERWPKETAGDLARHRIALRLLREEKYPEAIAKLSAITPGYPSYVSIQLALARAALQQAEQDKADAGGYRQRAVAALAAIPEPSPTADATTNRDYIQAKLALGWELYKDKKKVQQVDALIKALAPKLASLRLYDDPAKDKEVRGKLEDNIALLSLYSAASQAEAHFKAGHYTEVTKLLDPVVEAFNANKLPQFKDNVNLAAPVLGFALKSHVQLGELDQAKQAIKALQALQADKGGDNGTTAVLGQLAVLISRQIEDLRKKGDKENLQKAQKGFTSILNEVAGGQKTPTPKLAYLLAKCYAGMDEHKKAADLLQTFAAPNAAADVSLHHAIQLLLIDELRLLKEFDKAKERLDEIMAVKDGKPGWGARNLDALKLRILLWEDQEQYGAAAALAARLVKQLLPKIDDNRMKEQYLELYYHLTYCILKNGQGLGNAEKAKAIKDAAQRIVSLEKKQSGFGSEESKKRFEELLEKETELREQYNALKGGK